MWQVPGAGASTYTNKLNGMKPAKLEHWRSFIFRGETWRQFPRPQLWNNLQRFRSMKLQCSVSPPVFCLCVFRMRRIPFWNKKQTRVDSEIFGTFQECSFDKEKKWASFDAPPTPPFFVLGGFEEMGGHSVMLNSVSPSKFGWPEDPHVAWKNQRTLERPHVWDKEKLAWCKKRTFSAPTGRRCFRIYSDQNLFILLITCWLLQKSGEKSTIWMYKKTPP